MQLSSRIPSSQLTLQQHLIADQELEQVFDNQAVNQLMAETNAGGFELSQCQYDYEKDLFNLQLKGITPEGRTFCGDTICLTAKRSEGKLKILQAEVDRSYMFDADLDF
jgi:hypothetical protein